MIGKRQRPGQKRLGVPSEHAEQAAVVRWLTTQGVLLAERDQFENIAFCSVPNGARVSERERSKLVAEGLSPGFPDLLIFDRPPACPDKVGVALEMKRRDGGKTPENQRQWHAKLRARGWTVVVANGAREAVEQLRRLGYNWPVSVSAGENGQPTGVSTGGR